MTIRNLFEPEGETEKVRAQLTGADGSCEDREEVLLREHSLMVYINEIPAMRILCTATELQKLVVGRLISEGIVSGPGDIESIYICSSGNMAKVLLKEGVRLPGPGDAAAGEIASCCTDNRTFLSGAPLKPAVDKTADITSEDVFLLAASFKRDSGLHIRTSGTHAAYLCRNGKVCCVCEDIGRHNAMDKVIGEIFLGGYEPGECLVYVTGRVPTDMVRKAVRAGIGGLVSKSVPTAEAVRMAAEYGLRLFFRAWPDSYEECREMEG